MGTEEIFNLPNNLLRPHYFPLLLACLLLMPSARAQHAVITVYHHVAEDTPPSTSLSPQQLRTQMEYLRDNDFEVWPLDQLLHALQEREPMPERVAALTFDDAYISIYETGFPLLQEFGFPMTLFVSTQPVDDGLPGYMTWEQIRELADAGVIIGNHMVNHPHMIDALPRENHQQHVQRLREELLHAEQRIRDETGQSHKILAYPYGEHDDSIRAMVEEIGFTALAQNSGAAGYHSDFSALPRYPLAGIYAGIESAAIKLQSLAFDVEHMEPRSPVTDSQRPAVSLQLAGDFNASQLACYVGGQAMDIVWLDQENNRFRLQAAAGQELSSRRFSYNCTAPKRASNRFYWFSKFWVRPAPGNAD